ncbi:MAG: signal peptidase II [Lachnospiraceae bacterium]|nr:signal peptidase II [Lachnospiraceae bacterium]
MERTGIQNKHRILAFVVFLGLVAVLFGLDVWTKQLAVTYLKGQEDVVLIPGVLVLHYLENTGAAFGILKGQFWVFYLLTFVICAGILRYLATLPVAGESLLPALSMLLLLAGALGNLKDRISLHYVVDFIYISLIDFPVFNVADIYVTTGVFLLAVLALWKE